LPPSPSAHPPGAIATMVHCMGTGLGKNQIRATPALHLWHPARLPTGYRHALPRPLGGGGGARSAGGVGVSGEELQVSPSGRREARSPPLARLTATVHCMGTSPGKDEVRACPHIRKVDPGEQTGSGTRPTRAGTSIKQDPAVRNLCALPRKKRVLRARACCRASCGCSCFGSSLFISTSSS